MKHNLLQLNGKKIGELIREKQISPYEVYEFYRARIERFDNKIKSFLEVFDFTEPQFRESVLYGLPLGVKDNICIKNKEITCASKILEGHISVYDATVIKKLREEGLIFMGRTNMDEFAFGSSCENSCYGPTFNPWNLDYVPGGSSGGSAAAVAARFVPFALGSDTGGSIRQPASFCGVVGFKPTYGRVSRFGLVAFGSSLDQIGPITTDFVDCVYLLNILCGYDSYDSTSAKMEKEDFSQYLIDDVRGVKIGIPKEYFREGVDQEVLSLIDKVKEFFMDKGAEVKEVSLPHTEYAIATYYIIGTAEASANLERFDGIKYGLRVNSSNLTTLYCKTRQRGFGKEAKRRIFLGTHCLSSGYYDAYYLRALKVRTLIKEDFMRAFSEVDVLLTPTSPTPPFKLGEKINDPLSMYLSDIFTISSNLAGLPAVSFPCGFTKNHLPVGVQLIGKPFDERTLIRLGYTYQRFTDFHTVIPESVR